MGGKFPHAGWWKLEEAAPLNTSVMGTQGSWGGGVSSPTGPQRQGGVIASFKGVLNKVETRQCKHGK